MAHSLHCESRGSSQANISIAILNSPCCMSCALLSILPAKVHACYHALRVNVGSDVTQIRQQYLQLAKELHPDATGSEAADDFQRVHEAYTFLTSLHEDVLQRVADKAARHARDGDAPPSSGASSHQPVPNAAHANIVQHREYLRNEGVGHGHNPGERDRQYRSHRLERGMSGALDYRANRWTDSANARAAEDDSSARPKELQAFDSLLAITRAGGSKHIASATLIEEQIKDAISRWDPREIKDFGQSACNVSDAKSRFVHRGVALTPPMYVYFSSLCCSLCLQANRSPLCNTTAAAQWIPSNPN